MGKNIVKETKSELKKVIWPTRQQVINSTGVVIAMVLIMGIIIFAFDFGSGWVIQHVIGTEVEHNHSIENNVVNENNVVENNTDAENNIPVETDATGEANQ